MTGRGMGEEEKCEMTARVGRCCEGGTENHSSSRSAVTGVDENGWSIVGMDGQDGQVGKSRPRGDEAGEGSGVR